MNDYNKTEIKHILDLYYEGKSSPNEEALLRRYFAGDDVDEEFADDKLFFNSLVGNDKLIEVPSGLEQRLSDAIDLWQENQQVVIEARKRFKIIKMIQSLGVAASIAILFAIGIHFLGNTGQAHEPIDTFTDPMDAYAETQRVLTLFAGTLEKGQKGIEIAEQGSEKAFSMAMEQLNKI